MHDVIIRHKSRNILRVDKLSLPVSGLIVILGKNGSGKSTFLRVLASLHKNYLGTILYKEQILARYPQRSLAREISFVAQSSIADDRLGLSARSVLQMSYYPYSTGWGWHVPSVPEKLWQRVIDDFRLGNLLNRPLCTLSVGERQKIFIAASFIQASSCIILDEPTAALDIGESVNFFRVLRSIVAEERRLVVCVTHDINSAFVYSDQILALSDARVVYFGSPKDCCQNTLIGQVYGVRPLLIKHPELDLDMVVPDI
jgi:iron complex transport system ATP-binding protein